MKRHAPATLRNREPILAVLGRVLPPAARVLEIASGSGEHAAYFAPRLPGLLWQPSDPDPLAVASIDAHRADADAPNLLPAIRLDVRDRPWPAADVVFCANMIHIAPWECGLALLGGAREALSAGGLLVLYGPFKVGGRHTAPSNEAFDADLRSRDPRWGVRDLEEVVRAADGFTLAEDVSMPANNRTIGLRRG
ncbi:MAG: DUF938 domain-containing protein [Myxococcota bacterium]